MGRFVSFVARVMQDNKVKALGIACDQSVAVLVSPDGTGRIVTQPLGVNETSDKPLRKAYFAVGTEMPRVCKPEMPLDIRNIKMYRLGAGDTFDFNYWTTSDGQLYTMNAIDGVLQTNGNDGNIY